MNTPGLFIVGAFVTLIVVAALALLIYGAILDGRDTSRSQDAGAEAVIPSPAHSSA